MARRLSVLQQKVNMGTLRGLHTPEDAEQRAKERRERGLCDTIFSKFTTSSDSCTEFVTEQRIKFIRDVLDPILIGLGLTRLGASHASPAAPGYFVHRALYSGPDSCVLIVDIGLPNFFNAEVIRDPLTESEPYPEPIEAALRILSQVEMMTSPTYKGDEDQPDQESGV